MIDIEKLDDALYNSIYGLPRVGDHKKIWPKIKSDKEILKKAVQVIRNKFNNGDIVRGLAISELILLDYNDVDQKIYNKLINSIYTNTDIARIVIDGYSNGGFSFLLLSLMNPNLKLTEEQKTFAVNEAMNKMGTTLWQTKLKQFEEKLNDSKINDDNLYLVEFSGEKYPVGAKTASVHAFNTMSSLNNDQAHGTGSFDIRYWILKNQNWSLEEKQKLIMDFWYNSEEYDETLEDWEWAIINNKANYKGKTMPQLRHTKLYEYSYESLLQFYKDKNAADNIWEEIQFCKQMHELRPTKVEEDWLKISGKQKKITI